MDDIKSLITKGDFEKSENDVRLKLTKISDKLSVLDDKKMEVKSGSKLDQKTMRKTCSF